MRAKNELVEFGLIVLAGTLIGAVVGGLVGGLIGLAIHLIRF